VVFANSWLTACFLVCNMPAAFAAQTWAQQVQPRPTRTALIFGLGGPVVALATACG